MNMNVLSAVSSLSPWSRQVKPHKITGPMVSDRNVGGWERILSAGLGALLMSKARHNRGVKSYLMGAVGLTLFRRGLSGQCPVYKQMKLSSTI